MADMPVLPLSIVAIGGYLTWFGVHYWASDVKWPSDPVKAVLTGKPLPDSTVTVPQLPVIATPATSASGASSTAGTGAGGTETNGVPPQQIFDNAGLQQLWQNNGGHASTANIAAAIALAESSGDSAVTSKNPDGGTNVGLWQLDTKGKGAGYTIDQLKDSSVNARVTVMASVNGTSWGAWETYVKGTYKNYLVEGT